MESPARDLLSENVAARQRAIVGLHSFASAIADYRAKLNECGVPEALAGELAMNFHDQFWNSYFEESYEVE